LLGVAGAEPVRRTLHIVGRAEVEALLAATETQLPPLAARAANDDDARVTATTVRWFIDWSREDLQHGQVDRAFDTARRLGPMLARAAAAPTRPRAPRYVTSPLTIDGPTFVGDTALPDGTHVRQPVWFVGLGAFGAVRRMVDQLPDIGTNIIQIEFGPENVLTSETGFNDQPIKDFLAVADRAAKAGVSINLLLSPHYFPPWALAKWPDLKNFNGGFLKFCIQDPRAKGVIERFLRHAVPLIKDHPALHSICLSNEPVCIDQHLCPTATAMWRAWLKQHCGTIATVNTRWHTAYADFDAVPIPETKWQATTLCYDYSRFNQEAFVGWHRWMADIIHEMAPAVPVHAKIMMSSHFTGGLWGPWCIAPELFAANTQINGNDCCKWPGPSEQWACEWLGENMGYDYQRAARDTPVFNSENHLILDRDTRQVSPAFIRNVYWQGAIHGQGATVTWIWERTDDEKSDFWGSLMERPECTESHGLTALDLARCAEPVAAIAKQTAPVAILWSQAAAVLDGDRHVGGVRDAYLAANWLDVPVGFVNEHDCEAYAAGRPDRALDAARLVLAPAADHVPDAVVAALKRFKDKGGRVVRIAGSLGRDECDAARPDPGFETWDKQPPRALFERLKAVDLPRPIQIGAWGLEVRTAVQGGRRVVNLCNYLRVPLTVTLPAAGTDLLSGAAVGPTLTVDSLTPRLVALPN